MELSESELMADLEEGTADAADRAAVDPLTEDELRYLYELFCRNDRFVSVQQGNEVVLSYDAGTLKMRRHGLLEDRIAALIAYEKFMGSDTMELAHVDYSYKPIKPILGYEQTVLEQALLVTHVPLFYGAMPNLGLYSQPDGPHANPAELMPQGQIPEAQAAYEEMVEDAVRDIVFAASAMHESGADGINLDTVGASGDADFLAALKATEILKRKHPDICIEIGMAGEFVLGMHGELTYEGVRLAGLYARDQVRLAEKAGATIFGPVVNTDTSMTAPWNVARATTFIKPCATASRLPIHANVGMGVGGVTVNDHPPVDVASRASVALVEICRLDGL